MCCGRGTGGANEVNQVRRQVAPAPASVGATSRRSPTNVYFEYVGATGMSVRGPVSGRRYRFETPGSRLVVDPRDKASMAAIPNLRQVAGA
jgi:hypothetical protein